MARTRKAIQPLNLAKYDVLIEDRGPRSDYFKISQFTGYFAGGRNAFLIAGAGVLRPGSEILVEILNKDGTTVYSAPVKNFIEGNSRLIQVEVYEDTPIGVGKIVVLGSTDTYVDGRPVPSNWLGKYNVRWVADVTISPLKENTTPIRFLEEPSLNISEKFYAPPVSSSYEQIDNFFDVELIPLNKSVYQVGYQLKLRGPGVPGVDSRFTEDMLGGRWLGLLGLPVSQSNPNLPWNPNSSVFTTVLVRSDGLQEVGIPITKIINPTTAESDQGILKTRSFDKTPILSGFFSGAGYYTHYPRIEPFGVVTASVSNFVIRHNKLLEAPYSASATSFAKIRIVDLDTISGEIHKIRLSYKATNEPGNYVLLGEVTTSVAELLAIDSGSKIRETGKFKDLVLTDYWYAATMSIKRTDTTPVLPITNSFYLTSSVATLLPFKDTTKNNLINSIDSTPPISSSIGYNNLISYFVGTKENNFIELFPTNEYTLGFDAVVDRTTGSILLDSNDYAMQVFLVPISGSKDKVISKDVRGQLLGTLTPNANFSKQNFERVEFNFIPAIDPFGPTIVTASLSGDYGLRFIMYGGVWNIANVSVKIAQEPFFSPDEVNFLIPNTVFSDKVLTFKADYLDINNNSVNMSTLSPPVYFTGSAINFDVFPYSGSAVISGSLYVSGSGPFALAVSGSTSINGNTTFTGLTTIQSIFEKATVIPTPPPSTVQYDVKSQVVLYYTVNTTNNWIVNIRGDATTALNDLMTTGQNMTLVLIVVNGAGPAYYQTAVQIDGNSVFPKWQGSTPPSGGTVNSADIYAYSIFKTGNNQFSVFASQVAFA